MEKNINDLLKELNDLHDKIKENKYIFTTVERRLRGRKNIFSFWILNSHNWWIEQSIYDYLIGCHTKWFYILKIQIKLQGEYLYERSNS